MTMQKAIMYGFLAIFFMTVVIFSIVLIQEGIASQVLTPIYNASQNILTNASNIAEISQRMDQYQSTKLNYDYVFLAGLSILELTAVTLALFSPKIPSFSFISFLFLGTILLIFIYPVIMNINNYFYNEFILNLFTDTVFIMPMYNYFMTHQLFISIANVVFILGINRFFGKSKGLNDNPLTSEGGV